MRKGSPMLLILLLGWLMGGAAAALAADLPDGMYARFETNKGVIVAKLYYKEVPITVANFVGLAEGTQAWFDDQNVPQRNRRFYDGLTFHRVVANFMVQGGDPQGNGRGGPGFMFVDEFHESLRHDKPGILSMANSGPNTNGSQFFITVVPTPWLNDRHSVFGEVVEGMDRVLKIRQGDTMNKVDILRIGTEAQEYELQRVAARKLREMKRIGGQRLKKLPEPTAEIDPARLPEAGRAPAQRIGLRYFLIHFEGAKAPVAPLIYSKTEALDVAQRFADLARRKGADFSALAKEYSDANTSLLPIVDASNERLPDFIRSALTLGEGQVSDPVESPFGYVVFRRIPAQAIKVSHILVTWQGARDSRVSRNKEEAHQVLESIQKEIAAGKSFTEMATAHSDDPKTRERGGEIGELARGQADPAFDDAAFALKPGEISDIVETSFGYHLIHRIK